MTPSDNVPQPDKSLVEQFGSWEEVYKNTKPEDLPWNAGAPDAELIRLVDSGIIAPGRAIDLGTGPGHDAIFLARAGFKVLAVDISPSAIALAKVHARKAGVEKALDYRVEDILKLSSPGSSAVFVNDRGCFHTLDAAGRSVYISKVARVLIPGGHLFLRTFCDKEPPGPGPHRFTREELEGLFSQWFDFVEFKEGIFDGPRKPRAFICLLRKKA